MRVIQKLLVIALVSSMGLFPYAPTAAAGLSDINLFAGSTRLPPNILIILDSSASMLNPLSGYPLGPSKRAIATSAIETLIETVNPRDSGTYTENAIFGAMTFRLNGGQLQRQIETGNTEATVTAVKFHATTNVGTPISGAMLDVARYYSNQQPWGSLLPWGSLPQEENVKSPFDFECRDTFNIFISDGDPSNDSIDRAGYWAEIGDYDGDGGAGQNGAEIEANVGVANIEWSDDIAKAMYEHDFNTSIGGLQNVTTHVIGFDTNGLNLQRMAAAGGGLYRTTNTARGFGAALMDLTQASFDSVASYSAAVVPTSRTPFGSSFYNAFFAPVRGEPLWEGHIEAFDLSPDGVILDAAGNPAVDPVTDELIDPHNPHWDAGVVLRSNSSRSIYTTIAGTRVPFSKSLPIKASLGIQPVEVGFFPNAVASGVNTVPLAEDALIDYIHGRDSYYEKSPGGPAVMRDTVLGDIFHSTPVIVGPPTTLLFSESGYAGFLSAWAGRQRVLYTGANDGMFHAFDAGALSSGDHPLTPAVETNAVFYTPGTGAELFGYVPGLLLDDIKFVPRNDPRAYYFVDGSPVVADVWLRSGIGDYTRETDEWSTVSIVGFREGGEGYLALDITDPSSTLSTDPHGPYPKFLWEFTDPKLGDAWSEPVITRVKVKEGSVGDVCGHDNGDGNCRERWVAIIGGGYKTSGDPNHVDFEPDDSKAGWNPRSKAIFMIDIATGAVLDKIEYDAVNNPKMIYSLPSEPAVLDTNFDGFADVVYIGDLGGQVWKWDISAIGEDSVLSDGIIDNWNHGIFFTAPTESLGGGQTHYKSIFYPPAATLIRNTLWISFATGEREQLLYAGDATADENNRVYVMKDYYPKGVGSLANSYVEGDLTDITALSYDNNAADQGYFFIGNNGEKYVSEVVIFAGYVIIIGFEIDGLSPDPCAAGSGKSKLYAFEVDGGAGYWTTGAMTPMEERYEVVGGGVGSTPRISIAPDPDDDKMYIKTSKGRVITIEPPPRDGSGSSMIYWKQNQ
jgi:type IV pilus assembly protein PilY1